MFKKVKTRLFSRYLFSIFCVVAIAVILVTLLIFTIYANLQVSSARTYSVHQLEQVCQMTDMLYNQMRSVNNQILQNSNTNRCLSSNTFNRLIEADAGIKLREIQTAQSYTRYVSLYNSASNRFVSSSTADFLTDDDIAYYYRRLPDNPGADTCLLRMIGANYATRQLKTRYVYSFVFRVQLRKGGSPDLIIVDVDEDYFNDSISNLRTSNGFQQVLLLNRYGEVFSTNIAEGDSETFTHAKPDNTIVSVEDFPELTDNSGSFSYTCADHTEAARHLRQGVFLRLYDLQYCAVLEYLQRSPPARHHHVTRRHSCALHRHVHLVPHHCKALCANRSALQQLRQKAGERPCRR